MQVRIISQELELRKMKQESISDGLLRFKNAIKDLYDNSYAEGEQDSDRFDKCTENISMISEDKFVDVITDLVSKLKFQHHRQIDQKNAVIFKLQEEKELLQHSLEDTVAAYRRLQFSRQIL